MLISFSNDLYTPNFGIQSLPEKFFLTPCIVYNVYMYIYYTSIYLYLAVAIRFSTLLSIASLMSFSKDCSWDFRSLFGAPF